MKQFIMLLLCTLLVCVVNAQKPSFSPSTFTAEDEITITVDVSGTGMAGESDAYIWIFSNPDLGGGKDGVVNGEWGNSSESAKMTSLGSNKFTFKFVPTAMFGQSPGELKSFGFLLKKKDGSKQTSPDYKPFFFDPLVFTPTMLRIFPSKVGPLDVVTLNFDRTYGSSTNEQRMTPKTVTITMYDDDGAQVGAPLTKDVKSVNATIWAASFIPNIYFTPAGGKKLAKFTYKFNGTVLGTDGSPTSVTSAEAEVIFTDLK